MLDRPLRQPALAVSGQFCFGKPAVRLLRIRRLALEACHCELAQDAATRSLPPLALARVENEPALALRDQAALRPDELRLGNHRHEDAIRAASHAPSVAAAIAVESLVVRRGGKA